jgi:hypothetical protein
MTLASTGVDGRTAQTESSEGVSGETRRRVRDCLFLVFVVAASVAPYVTRLGFYSDDWAFLGSLNSFGDFSNAGRSTLFAFQEHIRQRPTQAVYSWLLFRVFHLDPTGYHLTNTIVVAAMIVLLYLVLRELWVARPVALSVAGIYAVLPVYSTDRFWFAAFGYPLSLAAYLLSLLANIRSLRSEHSRWRWKAVALVSLVVGGLGYEIVIPLFAANVVLLAFLAWRSTPRRALPAGRRLVLFLGMDVVALSAVVAYKIAAAAQSGVPPGYAKYVLWLVTGTLVTNLGTYGIGFPRVASWAAQEASWPAVASSVAVGAATFAYVLRAMAKSDAPSFGYRYWIRLALIGIATLFAGYSIFLVSARILFTSTGINNRVSIAGALGSAVCLVAASGIVARLVGRRRSWRGPVLSALVGVVCLSGTLTNAALADRWAVAWEVQQSVLHEIRDDVSPPPRGSTLILDGVCPYVGPAIVFESNWDLAGALEVLYDDPTIRADVTSADLKIGPTGISTTLYGDHVARYTYGPSLILYKAGLPTIARLTDERTARALLRNPDGGCERGAAGSGVPLFELDRWFHRLELRYFWQPS